ncbi:MAG TPA: helix-turn-helix transcriptional regulator [Thermodesulfobacteriota bacterium]|nr:helix-turn-helix transcriptional regulator [Thermodesulfobacteriota bacterium]
MDGQELRKLRKKANLSQWEVPRAVGKTAGWLGLIERGFMWKDDEVLADIATAIEHLGIRKLRMGNGKKD